MSNEKTKMLLLLLTLPLIGASSSPEEYNQLCTTPGAFTWCRYDCEMMLNASLLSCQGNAACISTVNREHAACMAECPCYISGKCITGCPCRSITPEVSIYNNFNSYHWCFKSRYCSADIDFIMLTPGKVGSHIDEAIWSKTFMLKWHHDNEQTQQIMRPFPQFRGNNQKMCTFILQGHFYMLGGDHTEYQAHRLSGCSWQRLPELKFKLDSARCTSIELQQRALLCASVPRPKDCWLFDGFSVTGF